MKRLLVLALVCLALVSCDNNKVAIPDENFEKALIELGYDDLIDGYVQSGIKNCKELDISEKGISNPFFSA
ncbi:MAG: hypothetical protein CL848_02975 [Crocinitomicaceae bacterium]|nr:hypothetical protein [Crocinitomicaceae bacterium]